MYISQVRTVISRNASVARRMRELGKKNHGKARLRPLRVSWLNRRKLFRRVSRIVIRVLKLLAGKYDILFLILHDYL